jgi:hypothetical protein
MGGMMMPMNQRWKDFRKLPKLHEDAATALNELIHSDSSRSEQTAIRKYRRLRDRGAELATALLKKIREKD